jgi:hypothetical protein
MESEAELIRESLEFRKDHFALKVAPPERPWLPAELVVSVTTNGSQWSSFSLLPHEVDILIEALKTAKWRQHMALKGGE